MDKRYWTMELRQRCVCDGDHKSLISLLHASIELAVFGPQTPMSNLLNNDRRLCRWSGIIWWTNRMHASHGYSMCRPEQWLLSSANPVNIKACAFVNAIVYWATPTALFQFLLLAVVIAEVFLFKRRNRFDMKIIFAAEEKERERGDG